MKTPHKESVEERMHTLEKAIDVGLRTEFDLKSCKKLVKCLISLTELIADEDEDLPIGIDDKATLSEAALIIIDVACCCWRNNGAAVTLPDDVLFNHIARMRLNPRHCKTVLDYTRMFLNEYDRLLSVDAFVNAKQKVINTYRHLIIEINERVGEFNRFLAKEHRLKTIHPDDPETFSVIENSNWVAEPLPNSVNASVYILGAHDAKNPSRLAAYVGRSSLKTARYGIRSVLKEYEAINPCAMQVGSSTFRIDVLLVVPVISSTRSLACALQEDIIKWHLKSVHLLNGPDTLPNM